MSDKSSGSGEPDQPSEREVRRIGLVAVHGIGEQGRFEFVDALVRDLSRAFKAEAGEGARVSVSLRGAGGSLMGAARPTLAEGPGPTAEIIVAKEDKETRVGIHEVWWGDIVDPPTPLQPLRFFAWGLAMWLAPLNDRPELKHSKPGTVGEFLVEPEPPEGRGFLAKLNVRVRLFFVGYLVIVIGIVLSLALALLRMITRQNIPDPVKIAISYMSDIKLYTQSTAPDSVPLDHLGQDARFAILARMVRTITDVAQQPYEHWWVLAHSLGSVVAFSGLMTPDGLIARYLDEKRWRRLARRRLVFQDSTKIPSDTKVACPAWLEPNSCVSRTKLLEKFAGLVTYGSPLDKFAMLWPAVVPINRDQAAITGRPWLNFYDETDPVAGVLDSFGKVGKQDAVFRPKNIGYAAHSIPLLSHLRYLTVPSDSGERKTDSLSARLARWWLDVAWPQDQKAPEFALGDRMRWLEPDADGKQPKKLQWPWPWRLRWAWTWAAWVVLAIASPFITAGILVWLRSSELLGRVLPEWLGWPAWLPDSGCHLGFVLMGLAVAIVFIAGLFGRLIAKDPTRRSSDTAPI